MKKRAHVILISAGLISLVAVGAIAGQPAYRFDPLPEPVVLSGNDIGFRVEGRQGTQPAGHIVIRVNGQWVVPMERTGTQPATK